MRVAIGSDHGGYRLKQEVIKFMEEKTIAFHDFGTYTVESVDYPDISREVAEKVAAGEFDRGILICGTGIGVCIAANKVKGVRAALCHDVFSALMSREHNDANVLTLGERVVGPGLALMIVETWLGGKFAGGRHKRRVEKIGQLEK